jgi:hypothetical protein
MSRLPKKIKKLSTRRDKNMVIDVDDAAHPSRQLAIEVLELFEDFLVNKGVVITNKERDEYDSEDAAVLFGSDYYYLEDKITRLVEANKKLSKEG